MTAAPGSGARFVVFEGGECVGKSTQAAFLAERRGVEATREPGGTPVGRELRRLLLEGSGHLDIHTGLDIRTEALLMAADRAQHVAETIRPALTAGRDVICDRYTGSSLAYQGYGRGFDVAVVRQLSEVATGGLRADLIVLLDMDHEVARGRRNPGSDRFEALDAGFHRRVREGFLELAAADPDRWQVLDANRDVEVVRRDVDALVAERFGW